MLNQSKNKDLIIKIKPRIHLTLIGMNADGYRLNGGVGFTIQEPSAELFFSKSNSFIINDYRDKSFSTQEIQRITNIVNKTKNIINASHNINVEIYGDMPTHFGFGSSTAIRLSCLEALHIINKVKYSRAELISRSGRGGTSGIGINTYFSGGFIIDLGKKNNNSLHIPSSMSENNNEIPLLLNHSRMPNWEIGICIPKNIISKSEDEEKAFFLKTCPISSKKVYEILYNVIYGLYPSIIENDKKNFCFAIKKIQDCAWKLAERNEYRKKLSNIENQLYGFGAMTVGMTSLGPSLFFIANDINGIIRKMNSNNDCFLIKTKTSNNGRKIIDA